MRDKTYITAIAVLLVVGGTMLGAAAQTADALKSLEQIRVTLQYMLIRSQQSLSQPLASFLTVAPDKLQGLDRMVPKGTACLEWGVRGDGSTE